MIYCTAVVSICFFCLRIRQPPISTRTDTLFPTRRSSDLLARHDNGFAQLPIARHPRIITTVGGGARADSVLAGLEAVIARTTAFRSEEHTSELQSLMRISYAVFCLKKKKY